MDRATLGEVKDKVKGLEVGAVEYIAKPFDPGEVLAHVPPHLKILRLERHLARKNRELEDANQRMRLALEAAICGESDRIDAAWLAEFTRTTC